VRVYDRRPFVAHTESDPLVLRQEPEPASAGPDESLYPLPRPSSVCIAINMLLGALIVLLFLQATGFLAPALVPSHTSHY
jgi:hypothetical protein